MKKYGFSFSWKRALGISSLRQKFAKKTGIPTTKSGLEKKIGRFFIKLIEQFFKNLNKNETKNKHENDL